MSLSDKLKVNPFMPSFIHSRLLGKSDTKHINPAAIASNNDTEVPSLFDAEMYTLADFIASAISEVLCTPLKVRFPGFKFFSANI